MQAAEKAAQEHYAARQRLVAAAAQASATQWAGVDPSAIATSWLARLPTTLTFVSGAQMAAARPAQGYVATVLAAQGAASTADLVASPLALAGIASDGRPLASLLYQPVVATLLAIKQGAPVDRALATGGANLDLLVRTQVADAGRVADLVAAAAEPKVTGYVRVLVPPSCSRCIILAGRVYEWNQGFLRHPRCDCIHIPRVQTKASGLTFSPQAHFKALSTEQQDDTFGKAGAQAIRDGGDISKVVNSRRGMYVAGGRRLTREAAGKRPRLMPEQILAEAKGDRAEALRLLRLHGYLRG